MKTHLPVQKKAIRNLGILIGLVVFSTLLVKSDLFCTRAIAFCGAQISPVKTSSEIAPQYFTFSQIKLQESLAAGKTTVLYFYAPWCTSCTSFEQELKTQTHQLPEDILILQVDYDSSPELKKQYNVLHQHTLILLDTQGNTKEMWIGGDLKSLLDYLKRNS